MATSMMRCMARPATTRCRPAALAASATALMRATLEAKIVTATRRLAPLMMLASERATSSSEGERPSRSALVESQIIAVTPSAPSCGEPSRSSVGGPITGVASIFQSPVCSTMPSGVRMATALDSGIECATEISSRSNGPTSKRLSSGHLLDRQLQLAAELGELGFQHRRRERRCIDRHLAAAATAR